MKGQDKAVHHPGSRKPLASETEECMVAVEALREGEQRFRAIFETSQDAMMLLNENGFFDCNPRTLEVFGFESKDDFITVHPADVSPPFQPDGQDSLSAAQARIETALREGTCAFQWVHRRTNGEDFPAEVLLSAFELGGRRVLQARVRDITERKQTDAERDRISDEIHDLYNNAPCGYHSVDENGTFIRMNDTELSWLGYTRDEIIGKKNMVDILTPKCQADFLENFPALREHGSVRDVAAEIVRKDGTIMPVLLSATAVTDAQGSYVTSRTMLFDITERKRGEEETRRIRAFLNAVVDSLPVAVFAKDAAEHRFTLWNRAAEVIFGMTGGEALGKNDYDFFPKEQADFFWSKDLETLSSDSVLDIPVESVDTPGQGRRYLHTQKVRVSDQEERAEHLLCVSDNITDRKRVEESLARKYQADEALSDLRRALLSTASLEEIASSVLALGKELTHSTYGFVGHIDADPGYLVGTTMAVDVWQECTIRDKSALFTKCGGLWGWVLNNKTSMLTNSPQQDERSTGTPEGHVPITSFLAAPALLDDEIVGVVALANSERNYDDDNLAVVERLAAFYALAVQRKRSEETLAKHAADLARSNADLQQFAYVASHDLQEPLRMVSSYIQLLAKRYEGRLDQDAGEFIGYAVDGTHRMQALINGLLDFSRVGTQAKVFEHTDCESVMKAATDNLKVALQESGAVVTHDPLPTVVGDAGQLTQLLQNLIGNAIKYHGDTPPKAHVSAEQSEAECIFSISDNGIGIAPEHFDRIFQIFQRLHAKGEYPGTGIGLAVCKRIVERHSGRIWVESEVGKGSTFRFAIPCNLATSEADGTLPLAA